MKKFENSVSIYGRVVDCTFEENTSDMGVDRIMGELIVRTSDDSEHSVNFYANKYKKDKNGEFSNDTNSFYTKYVDFKENVKTIKNSSPDETVTFVRLDNCTLDVDDYKAKDTGELKSYVKIWGKFINVVAENQVEKYKDSVARFTVTGIINNITDEIKNDSETGRAIISFAIISQFAKGFGKEITYSLNKIVPFKIVVDNDKVEAFKNIYYDGAFTTLGGILINKADTTTVVEKHEFGENTTKVVSSYERYNVCDCGNAIVDMNSIEDVTEDDVQQLFNARKALLAEIKNGNTKVKTQAPVTNSNGKKFNPFTGERV